MFYTYAKHTLLLHTINVLFSNWTFPTAGTKQVTYNNYVVLVCNYLVDAGESECDAVTLPECEVGYIPVRINPKECVPALNHPFVANLNTWSLLRQNVVLNILVVSNFRKGESLVILLRPKRSLRCLLIEVPWQINEFLNLNLTTIAMSLLFYFSSYFDQEIVKWLCGLRVCHLLYLFNQGKNKQL